MSDSGVAHGVVPLFVFGTLMDREVFEIVCDRAASSVRWREATLDGHARRVARDEPYPVLVASADESVSGFVLEGLDVSALARARFFEGEEFELEGATVRLEDSGAMLAVVYFADRRSAAHESLRWELADWQRDVKADVLPRVRRYMSCYGRMSVAEADAYW